MTEIDFYLLAQQGPHPAKSQLDPRMEFAVRLCHKVVSLGHQVFICTENEEYSQTLSAALWQYRPESFLANQIIDSQNPEIKVLPKTINISHNICKDSAPALGNDLLINLSLEIPAIFSRFNRHIEIVSDDESIKEKFRNHWAFYQQRGYSLKKHDLRKFS